MKNKIYQVGLFLFLSFIMVSCVKDNMPGPNAQVFGAIRDSVGGGLVETDLVNGSVIEVFELGYPTQVSQKWLIKQNGEYRNNLVFSGNYDIYLRNGNFFPYTIPAFNIKPGENKQDFVVVPYIRIKNCTITYDAANKKINASFSLEAGSPLVKVQSIRLYAFSDMYVGEQTKFGTSGTTFSQTFSPVKVIDNSTYNLSIDLAANASLFPTGRDYFFRVGSFASVSGVGTIRSNYAPYVKISL